MNEMIIAGHGELAEQQGFSADMFDRWTAFIDGSQKTIDTYTRAVRQFAFFLQANGIRQPQRQDVMAFRDCIAKDHKPTTVQSYLMAVKQFFKWTAQEGLYPNIADHVKSAKLDRGFKKDYLTSRQVGKMLNCIDTDTLKGKRDYAILSLMVTTGLRTIEVVRADVGDLRTVADFTALYVQGKGHLEKTDYVKVVAEAEEAIRDYLQARGKAAAEEPLFESIANRNTGGRMTTRSVSRIAKNGMVNAGLNSDRLTAHSLRHTTATLNLLNGGTPEETMQLLRHSNLNTTLIYSHALERAKNNSEERVAKAIFR